MQTYIDKEMFKWGSPNVFDIFTLFKRSTAVYSLQ